METRKQLIEKYGKHSWKIFEFANLLRNEEISESYFRELVRNQFNECFKELSDYETHSNSRFTHNNK